MKATAGEQHRSAPRTVDELDDLLSQPTEAVVELFGQLAGDIAILGVGGKMGPTLARMAVRASEAAGIRRRVYGISRFRSAGLQERLASWGIETIAADLLDEAQLAALPDAANVISMAGFKFGASDAVATTWATNCILPVLVCRKYRNSRIVSFSTGNVYGMVSAATGGSVESDPPDPQGEYAMAALGRERIYEYFSMKLDIPQVLLRLNYATELRYGVQVDLAEDVLAGRPIDMTMGFVNLIWQRDANAMALRALAHCQVPANVINVAGSEVLKTREIATHLATALHRRATFVGEESDRAFLNNGSRGYALLGHPLMTAEQLIHWTADWIAHDRPRLGKPTHFQQRDGKY